METAEIRDAVISGGGVSFIQTESFCDLCGHSGGFVSCATQWDALNKVMMQHSMSSVWSILSEPSGALLPDIKWLITTDSGGHGKGRRLYHGSVRNAVSSFGSWGDESYKSQCHLAAFKQVLPGSGYRIFAAQAGHCLTLDPWLDPSEQFYTSEKSIPLLCNFLTLRNIWDLIKLTYWDISSWFVNVHMFYYFL